MAAREQRTDIAAVKALAHPLRLRLLDLLRFEGPSTATLLARRVGESSGATSYHLRQLARHGFIEDAGTGKGRERWWRYTERRLKLSGEGKPSERDLLAELLSREAHALDRYLADPPKERGWDDAGFFMAPALRLTVDELDDLRRGLDELISPLRRADADDAPADARPVRLLAFGYPQPLEQK
jgi:DNA-binding transcriptional ArsR family regulator